MKAFFFPTAMAMCCAAVCAQQAGAPAAQKPAEILDDPATRIILDVTRVNMLFTVTDKKGRSVTDLTKEDFQVLENKNPQTIAEFTAETDLPLRLGILIDTSNSIRERFKHSCQFGCERAFDGDSFAGGRGIKDEPVSVQEEAIKR